MAQLVPVQATPYQSLNVVLSGQSVQITLYSLETPGDILTPLPVVTGPGGSFLTIDSGVGVDSDIPIDTGATIPAGSGPTIDSSAVTIDSSAVTIDEGPLYATTLLDGEPALYMDIMVNGQQVLNAALARNLIPMLLAAGYYGVEGDFVFVDTNASNPLTGSDPIYTGLGDQFQLVYQQPVDLPQ